MAGRWTLVAWLALGACGTPRWDGRVSTWGSMREVMREGRTEGRVALDAALGSPTAVGIGALEGLRGEIAVVDGIAWVARVEDGRLDASRGARPGERATLLALGDVPAWDTIAIGADVAPEGLEPFLAGVAKRTGLGAVDPWPFVIEGEFSQVDAHVLNGECPFAGPVSPEHEPLRRSPGPVRGTLVGFFAPAAAGTLVHHGQSIHVHLLVEGPEPYVGHVDRVAVAAGARLRVPSR